MAHTKNTIAFYSKDVRISLPPRSALRSWLNRLAKSHRFRIDSLTYVFVSDKALLAMNKEFLNHNTLTDIITFPMDAPRGEVSGEIYISIERVRDNAAEYNQTIKDELSRVMAHGLLHLCGFGDKSARQQKRMRSEEEKALDLRTF